MTMGTPEQFAKDVAAWVAQSKQRMLAVRNASVQALVEEMQTPQAEGGAMPVATGYLRSSLVARIGIVEIQSTTPNTVVGPAGVAKPATGRPAGEDVGLVLAQSKLEDPITIGWTANYAQYANYRAQFVGLGMQRWPQIVRQQSQNAFFRVAGGNG